MKSSENLEENLILYIEGKLNDKEKKEIEEHIKICERCRSYVEYVKKLLPSSEENTEDNYWIILKEKILKRIEDYKETRFSRIIRIKKITLSFMIVFILATTFFNIFQEQINLIRHLHLFKDYHIIKNLDTLKEIIAMEEENE
ncbi:MAG TPA: zf-HC2 domain-containing protein [bacterium]|nr:zf-HC2 domain-containing protein [bacterium]HOM26424.1 zf-HC2 domain-containing protein [bacterium]